jgi:hypothetical protein
MLSAAECRAKAAAALASASALPDAAYRRHFEAVAREWTALALTADVQEVMQARLMDRLDPEPPEEPEI